MLAIKKIFSKNLEFMDKFSFRRAVIICAWGDRGAMAITPDGTIVQSPAFSPLEIVDTLGAGDTFTAATLHYLNMVKMSRRQNIQTSTEVVAASVETPIEDESCSLATPEAKVETTQNSNIESLQCSQTEFIDRRVLQGAVTFACRVAGAKVGSRGYDGIVRAPEDLLSSSLPR